MNNLTCSLDGNCLSIVRNDFINLAESPAIFIELTPEQITKIRELQKLGEIDNEQSINDSRHVQ